MSALLLLSACSVNPLSRKYEYEEETYVNLDGSATVYVNAAVPALVALRGVDLPHDARARLDRNDVRVHGGVPAGPHASGVYPAHIQARRLKIVQVSPHA